MEIDLGMFTGMVRVQPKTIQFGLLLKMNQDLESISSPERSFGAGHRLEIKRKLADYCELG
jgi:hypothetical protein